MMHSLNNIFSSVGEYAQWAGIWRSAGKEVLLMNILSSLVIFLPNKLNERIAEYQIRQKTKKDVPPPLRRVAMNFLENLMKKADTTKALKIYFQQILGEKTKAHL